MYIHFQSLFQTDIIKIVGNRDNLWGLFYLSQERDNMQKSEFLKALSDMWKDFDSRVLRYKVDTLWLLSHILLTEKKSIAQVFALLQLIKLGFVTQVLPPLCAELRNLVMQPVILPMVLTIAESQVLFLIWVFCIPSIKFPCISFLFV